MDERSYNTDFVGGIGFSIDPATETEVDYTGHKPNKHSPYVHIKASKIVPEKSWLSDHGVISATLTTNTNLQKSIGSLATIIREIQPSINFSTGMDAVRQLQATPSGPVSPAVAAQVALNATGTKGGARSRKRRQKRSTKRRQQRQKQRPRRVSRRRQRKQSNKRQRR